MKKYSICFIVFLVSSIICLLTGYMITRYRRPEAYKYSAASEAELESETVVEDREVVNKKNITNENSESVKIDDEKNNQGDYYLVSEAGVLIVCLRDMDKICLYTHIPVTDFPEAERVRLMEGIWFKSMGEVLNYLESYTS